MEFQEYVGETQLSYAMVRQRGITWEKPPWKRITKPASNVPVLEQISSVLPQVWIALWHENTEVLVQVVKLLGLVLGFGTTASRSQHVASVGGEEARITPSGRTTGPTILQLSRCAIYGQSFRISAWARIINMIGIVRGAWSGAAWCSDFQ